MLAVPKSNPSSTGRRDEWIRVAAIGVLALLLLDAAADRRNGIVDTTDTGSTQVERTIPLPTNEEMMREMMTHD